MKLLSRLKYDLKWREKGGPEKGMNPTKRAQLVELIDDTMAHLKMFAKKPKVFGFEIDPTVFNVFQGYLLTGALTLASKIVSDIESGKNWGV